MKYEIIDRVSRFVKRLGMVQDPETMAKAKAEIKDYDFRLISMGHYAVIHNGKMYVIIERDGKISCSCDDMTYNRMNGSVCKHIIAFSKLLVPPEKPIDMLDGGHLLNVCGWTGKELHPPEIQIPPDPDLDLGVDDPLPEPPEPEQPAKVTVKCQYCKMGATRKDQKTADAWKEDHETSCPKNPANKQKPPRVTQEVPVVKETMAPEKPKEDKKVKPPSKKTGSLFDWIENLVEFGVGQIFGESGEGKTALCRELAVQVADEGKKVVYWDTEGNMTRKQRAAMTDHKNIEYILDRDWEEIRHMLPIPGEDDRTGPSIYAKTPKLKKCDLFILDSIGVPVLGIYGDLKQNEKGSALQGMQGLVYRLTTWAEKNEAVVIVTNQPVSAMNKTKAQIADRPPFGDKMKYFTKEIMKMVVAKRTDLATVCNLLTWRTRDDKRGKILATVTISDNGVEVMPTGGV